MKKSTRSILSLLLAVIMLTGVFAACSPDADETGSTSPGATEATEGATGAETEAPTSGETDGETETPTSGETDGESETPTSGETDGETTEAETDGGTDAEVELTGKHADLINHTNALAGRVQAYFKSSARDRFVIANTEMSIEYARSAEQTQLITSITNTKGNAYVTDTMDTFIRMTDGSTYYNSQSAKDTSINLYRFGYYYYQALYEGLNFVPKDYSDLVSNNTPIDLEGTFSRKSCQGVEAKMEGDNVRITVKNASDPKAAFAGLSIPTEGYNIMTITVKGVGDTTGIEFHYNIGTGFNSDQRKVLPIERDGEFHTYSIPLFDLPDYNGTISSVRVDPEGPVESGIVISDISFAKGDFDSMPQYVSTSRQLHVYSDKMHHLVQFSTSQVTDQVAAVGILTELDEATVEKLLVVFEDESTKDTLDGVDWDKVRAVAFDVKDAGIFGIILPNDEVGGRMTVTLADGKYTIIQERTPENGTLIPSEKGTLNANDFYVGSRVYTDENHDYEEFLYENWCEQNPLTQKNIKVSQAYSDGAEFVGYDAARGVYVLTLDAPDGDFWGAYYEPQKNYKVNFNISAGEIARDIYIMTSTSKRMLECAALLDEDLMMLPIPIEVIKNFTDGNDNLYNLDDHKFSEAILTLSLEADEVYEYTFLNLYQNWGNFPLKQISQIPFHLPYYHLSTGVTETNCITPWFASMRKTKSPKSLNTLPDHRAWSAPMWTGEPQHTNSGTYYWLEYTDADGNFISTENQSNDIISFGPTYAEVVMNNISDDGKIAVKYTHMEMPQTDENRAYYTIEYTVLEDVVINDFKNNFQFMRLGDNDSTGCYQKIGFLNESGATEIVDANKDFSKAPEYALGKEAPFFTFFEMSGPYDSATCPDGYSNSYGYSNIGVIINSSEMVIGGEEYDPDYVLINTQYEMALTLDLGDVTLKAGDTVKIELIAMPWGSQESVYDGSNSLSPIENILAVRENSCLDPIVLASESDTVLDRDFLPAILSSDGKSATFTVSGGKNENGRVVGGTYAVAVRAYGFDMLTAPRVQELIDGVWTDHVISSSAAPINGIYHYYDGYCVYYDGDGTYSYSFVFDMTDSDERTFRILADEEFDRWPAEELPEEEESLLMVYFGPDGLKQKISEDINTEIITADGESYISIYPRMGSKEYYTKFFTNSDNIETGNFFTVRYRIPSTNTDEITFLEVFTSTEESNFREGHNVRIPVTADGEWHVAVVDFALVANHTTFIKKNDVYKAKYIRFDIFNKECFDADTHIDIAYVGMDASLEEICTLNSEMHETVTLYENGIPVPVNTTTFEKEIKTYLHPSSGYTEAEILYGAAVDNVSGKSCGTRSNSKRGDIVIQSGYGVTKELTMTLAGWCLLDGGVDRYVWSIDGGRTWTDCIGNDTLTSADNAIVENSEKNSGGTYADRTASNVNSRFQENGNLIIDLSAHAGKTVEVVFAAVSAADTSKLVLLFAFENVKVEYKVESIFDSSSQYIETDLPYGVGLDKINSENFTAQGGTAQGIAGTSNEIVADLEFLTLEGWVALEGGVSKYVWTADLGKTWYDCAGAPTAAYDAILRVGAVRAGLTAFEDPESTKIGANFQSTPLELDLSELGKAGETVEIYVCAVSLKDESKVAIAYRFTNVKIQ